MGRYPHRLTHIIIIRYTCGDGGKVIRRDMLSAKNDSEVWNSIKVLYIVIFMFGFGTGGYLIEVSPILKDTGTICHPCPRDNGKYAALGPHYAA